MDAAKERHEGRAHEGKRCFMTGDQFTLGPLCAEIHFAGNSAGELERAVEAQKKEFCLYCHALIAAGEAKALDQNLDTGVHKGWLDDFFFVF